MKLSLVHKITCVLCKKLRRKHRDFINMFIHLKGRMKRSLFKAYIEDRPLFLNLQIQIFSDILAGSHNFFLTYSCLYAVVILTADENCTQHKHHVIATTLQRFIRRRKKSSIVFSVGVKFNTAWILHIDFLCDT